MLKSIKKNFLVGDGKYYGKYYNAPLEKGIEYNFVSGIVSSFNGKVKRAFSALDVDYFDDSTETTIQGVNKDSPALIIGLSIAIALLSFMFIAGIIGFIILKSRVTHRRQALSDNLEFTIQGPMIEVVSKTNLILLIINQHILHFIAVLCKNLFAAGK